MTAGQAPAAAWRALRGSFGRLQVRLCAERSFRSQVAFRWVLAAARTARVAASTAAAIETIRLMQRPSQSRQKEAREGAGEVEVVGRHQDQEASRADGRWCKMKPESIPCTSLTNAVSEGPRSRGGSSGSSGRLKGRTVGTRRESPPRWIRLDDLFRSQVWRETPRFAPCLRLAVSPCEANL